MQLSIVTSLYNGQDTISDFIERSSFSARELVGDDYEIIVVNDGSEDDGLLVAKQYLGKHKNLVLVDLSRNFGHHEALLAGLECAVGQRVFLIDSDLEEPPELVGEFWAKMESSNYDSVYGIQRQRKGRFLERLSGAIWYWFLERVTRLRKQRNVTTARMMTKEFKEAAVSITSGSVTLSALFELVGFKQISLVIDKSSKDSSTYSFGKKMRHVFALLTRHSFLPLIFPCLLGAVGVITGFVLFAWLGYLSITGRESLDGWRSIVALVVFMGGLNLVSVSILSAYIWRLASDTSARRLYIIKDIVRSKVLSDSP